jgi:hypothetical protein
VLAQLKDLYQKLEGLRGKSLLITLAASFGLFLVVGLIVGYFINAGLTSDELSSMPMGGAVLVPPLQKESHKGKIEHIAPLAEGIEYVLVDEKREDVLYLRADDDKLAISEGLFVTVVGTRQAKTNGQKLDTLVVGEVIISNETN